MDWRHIAACRDETRSCSSRSATPVPPCCRSRKPSRSAVAARSAKSACSSRWRPDRTPASGGAVRGRASSTETTQRPGEGARLLSRFDCAPPALRLAGRFDGRVPTGPTDPRPGGLGPPTRLGFLRSDAARRRACRQAHRPPRSGRSAVRAGRTRRRRTRGQSAAVVVDHDPKPPARRSAPSHTSPGEVPKPCSTAFCNSSVRAIASGVASPESSTPKSPARLARAWLGRGHVGNHREQPVRYPSKSTVSSTVWDSVSCTIAMEPTRRTASSSAARPPAGPIRRACSRNKAATVCRLFFTR